MDINGTPQPDVLVDTAGNDTINGGAGDDRIDVTNGQDLVDGGADDDLLRIRWAAETAPIVNGVAAAGYEFALVGGAGRSISFRGIEDVEVEAGSGNDNFTMGATNDRILDGPRNVSGNLPTGDDVLGGGAGNDVIDVTTGNDSADGGIGDDRITINYYGSTVAVTNVAAPVGFDGRFEAGPDRSINFVGFEDIFISGGSGNDNITTFGGDDLIGDGPGTTVDNDILNGGAGDDRIDVELGHDLLDGGTGDDTGSLTWTDSTAPIISVAAPVGYDLRFQSGANYSANFVNIENVVIFAGTGDDNVTTGNGSDIYLDALAAASGNDTFNGAGGDDFQFIRTGNDRGDGGTGRDGVQIEWDDATAPIVMGAPAAGWDIRFVAGAGRSAELRNVEEITFFSGSGSDILAFGDSEDFVFGANGNDSIEGGGGNDFLEGDAGNDTLGGDAGEDDLYGGAGNDTLRGGDGNDFLYAGAGIDTLFGDGGDDAGFLTDDSDSFTGGAGTDSAIVVGQFASFTARVSPDTEVLLLASGTDTRFGDGNASYDYNILIPNTVGGANEILTVQATGLVVGEDLRFDGSAQQNGQFRIFAGRGVDELIGGARNDGFFFDADANGSLTGADRITGGGGADTIALRGDYTGAKAVTFLDTSMSGVEVVAFLTGLANPYGGPIVAAGFDFAVTMANGNVAAGGSLDIVGSTLRANESVAFDGRAETDGAYRIFLGAGDDNVFGGQGADLLYGALGADQLDGSGGADTYVYRATAESTAASTDTVQLGDGDRIDLSTIDADGAAAGNQAFTFIGSQAFGNVAGQLRAAQSGNIWVVEGDVDGNGTADLVINVTSVDAIVAGDFIL
jgi:Ca2+-binding RTX toxin-like protein